MIAETIARIEAEVPGVKLVGTAADFQTAADTSPKLTPAAFVIPLQEEPSPNSMGNIVLQKVTSYIGVTFCVRNVTDPKGAAAKEDLDTLRDAVKAVLLGWVPVQDFAPYERRGGRLLAFKDGNMWWQDIYVTSYYERSAL